MIISGTLADPSVESYASVAFATAYHAKRGNTAWSDLDASDREIALVKATDYLHVTYRDAWRTLDDVTARDLDVSRACAELAIRSALGEDLLPDQERTVIAETIGPISTTYDRGSPVAKRYAVVDRLLAPYLVTSGPMVRIGRA